MAEHTVRVWRRTRPLTGDPTRVIGLEREGGHLGIGDYTLCELAFAEDEKRRAEQSGDIEK
jgi:hypothetical protein